MSSLRSICEVRPSAYLVALMVGSEVVKFEFRVVERSGIDVVICDAAFQKLADENLGQTGAILECVQAFHRAQRTEFRQQSP